MATTTLVDTPHGIESARLPPYARSDAPTSTCSLSHGQTPAPAALKTRAGRYLTFALANQEFGIQVLKVREIIGRQDITAVPQIPKYVKGVIDLRGRIIPVIDLRLRFGLAETDYTPQTCIIVVQVERQQSTIHTGIIIDAVSEVLNLVAQDIEDAPRFDGNSVGLSYLLGMAKVKGKVKILLDIDRVLSAEELRGLGHISSDRSFQDINADRIEE